MEGVFKFLFGLAVVVFCLTIIGLFLLIVKIILMFHPQVHLMGVILS